MAAQVLPIDTCTLSEKGPAIFLQHFWFGSGLDIHRFGAQGLPPLPEPPREYILETKILIWATPGEGLTHVLET